MPHVRAREGTPKSNSEKEITAKERANENTILQSIIENPEEREGELLTARTY
jgi:hypothetical protein